MPSRSWIRSREAPLWRGLTPRRAGAVVGRAFGEEARAEALLRAFLAERDRDAAGVRFWLAVHAGLVEAGGASRGAPVAAPAAGPPSPPLASRTTPAGTP